MILLVVLFLGVDGLVYWSHSTDAAARFTEFIGHPVMFSQALLLAIWLAIGRQPLVLRIAVWFLGVVLLFCLFSANWLVDGAGDWNTFAWLSFFGGCSGSTLMFATPGILLCVTLPLLISRHRRRVSPSERLTLKHLLIAIYLVCISLAFLMAVSQGPWWPLILIQQGAQLASDPVSFFILMVLPTAVYSVIAFASMWCASNLSVVDIAFLRSRW